MEDDMQKASLVSLFLVLFCLYPFSLLAKRDIEKEKKPSVSKETAACIGCHKMFTPGIVEDWLGSIHAKTTPAAALKKPDMQKRMSAKKVSPRLEKIAVGCFECHSQNPDKHKDNFAHNGFRINAVVTPNDCSICHPAEIEQFAGSKKAHAVKNIMANPLYHTLVATTAGVKEFKDGKLSASSPSADTLRETCLGCHGTKVEVKGMKKIGSAIGEIEVPILTNWPNQGVGRENPDGSLGACTACHPRHGVSIEIARKPYTCAQCHLEPDVPAWDVYKESKHGNIFFAKYREWDFNAVPWSVGKGFKAPTCATCHNSLVVSPEGKVIAERTHDFGARLWVRLFGLIYSHPQPKSGDTTLIRNSEGQPLPATFTGELAAGFLIDKEEQDKRLNAMKKVCNSCHGRNWIDGHFAKLDTTLKETDAMTLAATKIMQDAWNRGIEDNANPFDEPVEMMWIKQWFFYSNSVRFASAMTGAPDYAAFKNGWWDLSENLQRMKEMVELKQTLSKKSIPKSP
jgi:hydroxylamine dehydrogenase